MLEQEWCAAIVLLQVKESVELLREMIRSQQFDALESQSAHTVDEGQS